MNIQAQLERYIHMFPEEMDRLQSLLLQAEKDPGSIFHRKTMPGHITSSGILVKDNLILLVRHPYLHKWLQPGGHVDPGETPAESAKREVLEETGVKAEVLPWHLETGIPIDIDIHEIPANIDKNEPAHLHYDFRYFLQHSFLSLPAESELPCEWKSASLAEDSLQQTLRKRKIVGI